jgi:hypothetical protein
MIQAVVLAVHPPLNTSQAVLAGDLPEKHTDKLDMASQPVRAMFRFMFFYQFFKTGSLNQGWYLSKNRVMLVPVLMSLSQLLL